MAGPKLLLLKSMPLLPLNGADQSMISRLNWLSKNGGWSVEAYCLARTDQAGRVQTLLSESKVVPASTAPLHYQLGAIDVVVEFGAKFDPYETHNRVPIKQAYEKAIDRIKPDLVFVNLTDFFALDALTSIPAIPSVVFITDNEFPRRMTLEPNPSLAWIIDRIRAIRYPVVASQFLKESFKAAWKINAEVVKNPVEFQTYRSEKQLPRTQISFVNPIPVKGVDLFLEIARAMPDRMFQTVGGWGDGAASRSAALSQISNLRVIPRQTDMAAVYATSHLVLVPSLWEEAFGRVVLEAMAGGALVIASDVGGLREAGAEAAIYLPVNRMKNGVIPSNQNVAPWISAIEAFDDPEMQDRYRALGGAQVAAYEANATESLRDFNRRLMTLVNRSIPA